MSDRGVPEIVLINRQRKRKIDRSWLLETARRALPLVMEREGKAEPSVMRGIDEISVAIVSDPEMARIHVEFMGIPGPTDVITFRHGEIVVSADTAAAHSGELGHSLEGELALYVVHGLLHLNGYDDLSPPARRSMHARQEAILEKLGIRLRPA